MIYFALVKNESIVCTIFCDKGIPILVPCKVTLQGMEITKQRNDIHSLGNETDHSKQYQKAKCSLI